MRLSTVQQKKIQDPNIFNLEMKFLKFLIKKTQKFFEKIQNIAVTLDKVTGKSFSESLILASNNPQYEI